MSASCSLVGWTGSSLDFEVFDFLYWQNLEVLDLSDNCITDLSESFCKLNNLRSLNVSKNELLSLPSCITTMVEMISVDLTFNFIDEYTQEVNDWLTGLKQLNENVYYD